MALDEELLQELIEKFRATGIEPDCILVHRSLFVPDTELEIIRLEDIPIDRVYIGIKGQFDLPEGEGEWRGDE